MAEHNPYYIPAPSHWPLVGSIGLVTLLTGFGSWLHQDWYGPYIFFTGFVILITMLFGWFGQVIYENGKGLYDLRVDHSFRWGMCWFIFLKSVSLSAFHF